MNKWTPGPWKCGLFRETGPIAGISILSEVLDESHARAWLVDGRPADECKANARLIAAAPEMYEALKIAEECLESGHWSETKEEIRALLARIKGEQ